MDEGSRWRRHRAGGRAFAVVQVSWKRRTNSVLPGLTMARNSRVVDDKASDGRSCSRRTRLGSSLSPLKLPRAPRPARACGLRKRGSSQPRSGSTHHRRGSAAATRPSATSRPLGASSIRGFLHLTPPGRDGRPRAGGGSRWPGRSEQRERICVFGDYDCDGITRRRRDDGVLRALGGGCGPVLASRYDGGYGLSARRSRRVSQQPGQRCSSPATAGRPITSRWRSCARRGIDVIVIDHHLVPEEPLPVLAFLNPHRPECGFPYKGLASCGLALSLGAAVRAKLGVDLDLRRWLDLVAIGTIADVAPLDGDNRALVRAGLRALERGARGPACARCSSYARIDAGCADQRRGRRFPHRAADQRAGAARRARRRRSSSCSRARTNERAASPPRSSSSRLSAAPLQERCIAEAVGGNRGSAAGRIARRSSSDAQGWSQGSRRYRRRPARRPLRAARDRGRLRGRPRSRLGARPARRPLARPRSSAARRTPSRVSAVTRRRPGWRSSSAGSTSFARLRGSACAKGRRGTLAPSTRRSRTNLLARFEPEDDPFRVLRRSDRLEPCGEKNPCAEVCVRGEVISQRAKSKGVT